MMVKKNNNTFEWWLKGLEFGGGGGGGGGGEGWRLTTSNQCGQSPAVAWVFVDISHSGLPSYHYAGF